MRTLKNQVWGDIFLREFGEFSRHPVKILIDSKFSDEEINTVAKSSFLLSDSGLKVSFLGFRRWP
mgnify:CR=1 FL=1